MRLARVATFAVSLLATAPAAANLQEGTVSTGGQETQPQPPPGEARSEELQKAVQNPVANLISVPFQNNIDYRIGPFDRARDTLNIQPVIPAPLGQRVMLISRTIVPLIYQPDVTAEGGGSSGLGDVNPTFFFAPAKPGKLIWGLGPSFLLPTATQRTTGAGQWCVGGSAVGLVQPGHWTLGVLATNLWSVDGPADRADINQLTVQYFVNYNLNKAVYLTSAPILTANWKAPEGDRWLVPFGGGVGAIFKLGKQPMNGQLAAYYNAVRPDLVPSPHWQLRVQLALLFPR
jgi:hypothetical protein